VSEGGIHGPIPFEELPKGLRGGEKSKPEGW
jgi:hypothetical protein